MGGGGDGGMGGGGGLLQNFERMTCGACTCIARVLLKLDLGPELGMELGQVPGFFGTGPNA